MWASHSIGSLPSISQERLFPLKWVHSIDDVILRGWFPYLKRASLPFSLFLSFYLRAHQVHLENGGRNREILAWGSVQLTCDRYPFFIPSIYSILFFYRTFGRRKTLEGTTSTSISKGAFNVFSSVPQVIFCDVDLLPGQSKTFTCKVRQLLRGGGQMYISLGQITIPLNGIPPSFKGHYIRYVNRITLAVARIRSTVSTYIVISKSFL